MNQPRPRVSLGLRKATIYSRNAAPLCEKAFPILLDLGLRSRAVISRANKNQIKNDLRTDTASARTFRNADRLGRGHGSFADLTGWADVATNGRAGFAIASVQDHCEIAETRAAGRVAGENDIGNAFGVDVS